MNFYSISAKAALKEMNSSLEGLKESRVKENKKKYGLNTIRRIKKKSKIKLFLSQFNSLLVYILIIAGIISLAIGHLIDSAVIFAIVLINSVIGFIQEYKAESIIEKLKKSLKYKVLVIRSGVQKEIDSKDLVPGDIVILNAGDKILTDGRILTLENFEVNESVLTGESFPIEKTTEIISKDAVLAERRNMVFTGTVVTKGVCKYVVTATAARSEFGKLAETLQTTVDEKMPIEKKLDEFSRNISLAILGFIVLAFLFGIYKGFDKFEMFLVSVSLAIGAIPEGLPAIIIVTLAVAIKQMYKVNTLVRKLPAAETLGRATVICTDKTGTLTEEELSVGRIFSNKIFEVSKIKKVDKNLDELIRIALLCNNARAEGEKVIGDPTEVALVKLSQKFKFSKRELTEENKRIKEFPFDSTRKLMSIVRKNVRGENISYVKGAPGIILERCTSELVNGRVIQLTRKRREELKKIYEELEGRGLRVLGFAKRKIQFVKQSEAENKLVFSGLTGMIDPPRKEVKNAIKEALDAGINVKIITGDALLTTKTIAEKIGLKGEAIEGRDLNKLENHEWSKTVRTKTIFARITPEQKLRIVEELKKQSETVAVTGDGVNDILALKRADIGISMGIRGSDVARDSSDMVLLDDNFNSIVKAIHQGRRVFDNLKKSIKFLLAANAGEVLIIIAAILIGLPLPFLPLAILWMNLVTDSLPALALAVEPAEGNVMRRRPKKEGILSGIWQWIVIAGILSFASSLLVFKLSMTIYGLEIARTMAVTTMIFFELFFAFSCKSGASLFKTGISNNRWLIYAVITSAALHIIAIYTGLGSIFGFTSLSLSQLGYSILAGLSGLIFFELWKGVRGIVKK